MTSLFASETKQRMFALLVAGCFFMENLDGTIVTTAVPQLSRSLGLSPGAVGSVMTVYLTSLAVGIPAGAWLPRRFGVRRIFLSALWIFTLASLATGLSRSLGMLIGARVVQGCSAALMVPVGRYAVLRDAPKREVVKLVAYIVWPGLLAPVMGPIVGGVIVTYFSWPWLFLINVPLGIIGLVVAMRLTPRDTGNERLASPNWGDLVAVTVGLMALMVAASFMASSAPGWLLVAVLLIVSGVALRWSMHRLRSSSHPFLDLTVWQYRSVRDALVGMGLFTLAVGATPLLLPLLLEIVWGWTPLHATEIVAFIFAGNIGIKPATTWLLTRWSHRTIIHAGIYGVMVSTVAFALLRPTSGTIWWAGAALLAGASRSVAFTAFITLGFSGVPERLMATANTLSATTQQVAAALALATGSVVFRLAQRAGHSSPGLVTSWAFGILTLVAMSPLFKVWSMPKTSGGDLV